MLIMNIVIINDDQCNDHIKSSFDTCIVQDTIVLELGIYS